MSEKNNTGALIGCFIFFALLFSLSLAIARCGQRKIPVLVAKPNPVNGVELPEIRVGVID